MASEPWLGDACSLVDAFRRRILSPLEVLDASLAAIERSDLNAFSHVDIDAALADVNRSKEAAGREKDRVVLPILRQVLERAREKERDDRGMGL